MTDDGKAFVRHWLDLRVGTELIARSTAFLDKPYPKLQPYVSFNDLDDAGNNIVTLFGTGLVASWGSDITGMSVSKDFPLEVVKVYEVILRACASQPCGIWEVSRFATSTGRVVTKEITTLPLTVKRPGTIRIARLHRTLQRIDDIEHVTGLLQPMVREWFDVGAGTPPPIGSAKPVATSLNG
jgi:hypothetical protein